ncbi:OmpH family outer membrane protein [Dysgonomonas massiliensis]|uniref:OmpH family outer membrane protein n=1 Tax=Dysgonomonas massiliensis TaxID=2040292 RepID=UPI000C77218E|nr:OmpH family outer membrane protein [Dysgonomonas massiliensis]
MKKFFLVLLVIVPLFFSNHISAQTSNQIAFVNSNEIFAVMPERIKASESLNELNDKYKAELEVMQNDYNKKYSDFISYQSSMGENIRLRRMQELYELERNINNFMKVAKEDVEAQEAEMLVPLRQKLKDAVYQVGVEQGYICVYDMANPSIIFVTPDAVDITPLVKRKLGIK